MNAWLYAWHNVLRNRRRSLITILIAALGCIAVLIASGFALYTYAELEQGAAYEYGHITVSTKNHSKDEEEPLQYGIENYTALMQQLSSINKVNTLLPKVELSGLISNGNKSVPFIGSGVDILAEKKVLKEILTIDERDLLQAKDQYAEYYVLLGDALARSLNAQKGSSLTLLATTSSGSINAIDVYVAGTISTGWEDVDQRLVYMDVGLAQSLVLAPKLSAISLYLDDTQSTTAVLEQLEAKYPDYSFKPWWQQAFYYQSVKELYNRLFGLLGIIIAFLVYFSVSNTLAMAVVERTREIGTLRALGALPKEIIAQFVREGVVIGCLGALIGMLISGVIVLVLPALALEMPPPPGRTVGYPLLVSASIPLYLITSICMVSLCAIAAWFVSFKAASKKSIVEALSHV